MSKTIEGERRWATVLFTDMVNSSALTEQIGIEQVYALIGDAIGLLTDCIDRHDGHIMDYAGDSILAAFGAPIALENSAYHACAAALDIQKTLAEKSDEFLANYNARPEFRVGISCGSVIVGQVRLNNENKATIMGDVVNHASRLESIAKPGEILISDLVFDAAEGFIAVTDLGETEFKGFSKKQQTYRLESLRVTMSRFEGQRRRGLVQMVGRSREQRQLLDLVFEKSDQDQLALLTGPAGAGKSRLIYELSNILKNDFNVYTGQCDRAIQHQAFGSLISLIRNATQMPREATLAQIKECLAPYTSDDSDFDLLATLFTDRSDQDRTSDHDGSDSRSTAIELRRQMETILRKIGGNPETILIIEDAHWIDNVSEEVLARIFDENGSNNIFALLTSRPEGVPEWVGENYDSRLDLDRLSAEDTRALAALHFENDDISQSLIDTIIEKSDGNPLFTEEIVRYLKLPGHLVSSDDGLRLSDETSAAIMSGNLQQLVLGRVDGLPKEIRPILETAAAVGRNFSRDLLIQVTKEQAAVDRMLQSCLESRLIEPDPDAMRSDTSEEQEDAWRFTHALIKDAIDDSLLQRQRVAVHRRIANTLEEIAGPNVENSAEALAYHYAEAEEAQQAIPHLVNAAQKSRRVYDVEQCLKHIGRIFQFVQQDPDVVDDTRYGEVVVIWLRILDHAGDFTGIDRVGKDYLPRMQAAGITRNLLIASTLCANGLNHLRDYPAARDMALKALDQANEIEDEHSAAWAKASLMRTYCDTNWESRETIQKFAAEIEPIALAENDMHLAMTTQYLLAAHFRDCGEVAEARRLALQIEDFADKFNDIRARAYASWSLAVIYNLMGEAQTALEYAERGMEIALPNSDDAFLSYTSWISCKVLLGDLDTARAVIDKHVGRAEGFGNLSVVHLMVLYQAILKIRDGKIGDGWKMLDEHMSVIEAAGNAAIIKVIRTVRGEFLLTLAGLFHPDIGKEGFNPAAMQRPKLGFSDLIWVIRLKLAAKKLAQADFEYVLAHEPYKRGTTCARAHIGLAVIAKAKKQNEQAQTHFDVAKELVAAEGVAHLQKQVEILRNR